MALDIELTREMTETVTVQHSNAGTHDGYGKRVVSAAVPYLAFIEQVTRVVRTKDNVEAVSTTTTYIATTDAFTVEDVITLPARCNPRSPLILQVEQVNDEGGKQVAVQLYT